MAGFQVSINGRFRVSTEEKDDDSAADALLPALTTCVEAMR